MRFSRRKSPPEQRNSSPRRQDPIPTRGIGGGSPSLPPSNINTLFLPLPVYIKLFSPRQVERFQPGSSGNRSSSRTCALLLLAQALAGKRFPNLVPAFPAFQGNTGRQAQTCSGDEILGLAMGTGINHFFMGTQICAELRRKKTLPS